MEEKERYEVSVGSDYITIYDYEENRLKALDNCGMQSLLNLQDNQIKAKEKEANTYAKEIVFLDNKIKQLKQSQRQLAVEELRRIKEYILINDEYDEEVGCNIIETFDLLEDIRDRIKELSGGENE